jgi:aspartate/methionine/tyrosine aminotransferase
MNGTMNAWFGDDQVPLAALRRQAFNLRWATLPEDVIPLTAADPDFAVAPAVREAIARQAAEGLFSYGPAGGLPAFRQACARFCRERRGMGGGAERILAVDGAAAGMLHVCRLLLRPGDEAIIFDPVDFLFQAAVEAAGASVLRLPVDPLSGRLELERLEALVTGRTRLLAVCNPLNPVGRVLRHDELMALATFAIRHDLAILNDEVWSDIVFAAEPDGREITAEKGRQTGEERATEIDAVSGAEPATQAAAVAAPQKPAVRFQSLAALAPEVAARCWTVHGFSKNYGLAGLRVGYVHCPDGASCERLLKASLADTTIHGVATLSQIAALAALEEGEAWLASWLAHLERQRNLAVAALATMPGTSVRSPEGTYVLFPRINHHGLSATALTERLLQRQRLALVPGAPRWFGPGAAGHLRLVFSTSEAILREGLGRLRRGLEELEQELGGGAGSEAGGLGGEGGADRAEGLKGLG